MIFNQFKPSCLLAVVIACSWFSTACAQHWPGDFHNVGKTFFEFGAKAYDRPGLGDGGFPVLENAITGGIILDSDDFIDLGGAAGAEVRFGSDSVRGVKWEARAFLTNWDEQFFFNDANLSSPFSPDLNPGEVDIEFDSEIFSLEFSFRKPITQGFTFLFGPRLVSFNEDLVFDTETIVPTPLGDVQVLSDNELSTRNLLLGGQFGGQFNFQLSRSVYAQGFIRVGGYANFIELRTFGDTSLTDGVDGLFRRNQSAFVGEVGGKLFWDIIPQRVSIFTGYEATWLDDVAVAPAQTAGGLLPTEIVAGDTPFFHAITVGLQFRR